MESVPASDASIADRPLAAGIDALSIRQPLAQFRTRALAAPYGINPAALARIGSAVPSLAGAPSVRLGADARVGIISNARAHRNRDRAEVLPMPSGRVERATPRTPEELVETLARFAARGIDVLVIDGGDGTIRDVITAAAPLFRRGMPAVAVVPSGKTNALATDLGIPDGWTLVDAMAAIDARRTRSRSPVTVRRIEAGAGAGAGAGEGDLHGFLFGSGAFVHATVLAQGTHRMGAFNGLAVGLSLAASVAQTIFGGRDNRWRRGDTVRIGLPDGREVERRFYLLLGSTLERLPLGLKPFGRPRAGLKLLGIDGPPDRLLTTVPALLAGSEAEWIKRRGYHRACVESVTLRLDGDFIMDGEIYPGGELVVARGAPIDFVVP